MQYCSTYIDMMDKMTIEAFMMIIMMMIDDRGDFDERMSDEWGSGRGYIDISRDLFAMHLYDNELMRCQSENK